MQQLGYLFIDGQTVRVLVRPMKVGVALKIRKSGELGSHMSDEEIALNSKEYAQVRRNLLKGDIVIL